MRLLVTGVFMYTFVLRYSTYREDQDNTNMFSSRACGWSEGKERMSDSFNTTLMRGGMEEVGGYLVIFYDKENWGRGARARSRSRPLRAEFRIPKATYTALIGSWSSLYRAPRLNRVTIAISVP